MISGVDIVVSAQFPRAVSKRFGAGKMAWNFDEAVEAAGGDRFADAVSLTIFQWYLRIVTVQPKPDYEGAKDFLEQYLTWAGLVVSSGDVRCLGGAWGTSGQCECASTLLVASFYIVYNNLSLIMCVV